MTKLYTERDIMALDEAGNYYCKHVSAMTSEKLHSKSDIAAELAQRDYEIEALKVQVVMLRVACQLGIDMFKANDINVPNTIETLQEAIDATPAQCLSAHDAKVAKAAINDFANHLVDIGQIRSAYPAEEYAAQLRAKAGE